MTLLKPQESVLFYSGDVDEKIVKLFKRAYNEGKLVCLYKRGDKYCYRIYNPKRRLTKKEKAARVKFSELATSGELKKLRDAKQKVEQDKQDAAAKEAKA